MVLFKPQFELGREVIGKGGLIRDELRLQNGLLEAETKFKQLDLKVLGHIESSIKGKHGNKEFLFYLQIGS